MGERLRSARVAAGLSTRALAGRLTGRVTVSHATLANYERGITKPGMDVISAIADELERPLQWFLQSGRALRCVRYRRRKSLVTQTACVQFEFAAQTWLDAYVYVEQKLGEPLSRVRRCRLDEIVGRTPEQKAKSVRSLLGLGNDDPVQCMPKALEAFGIRVLEVSTDEAIDGLAAMFGNEHVTVLARGLDGDRSRLNAAHEFGHIVAGDVESETEDEEVHRSAFEFGAYLLMPSAVLKRAVERHSIVHLVEMKKLYGVSLAAMIYRAEKSRYLSAREAKDIWIEFAKRGWRQHEPGRISPDRALRFEVLFERAVSLKKVTLEDVSRHSGLSVSELKRRLSEPAGYIDEPVSLIDSESSSGLKLSK